MSDPITDGYFIKKSVEGANNLEVEGFTKQAEGVRLMTIKAGTLEMKCKRLERQLVCAVAGLRWIKESGDYYGSTHAENTLTKIEKGGV